MRYIYFEPGASASFIGSAAADSLSACASAPADSDARAVAAAHDFPTGCLTRGELFSCSSFSKTWASSRSVFCLRTRLVLIRITNPWVICDKELPGLTLTAHLTL